MDHAITEAYLQHTSRILALGERLRRDRDTSFLHEVERLADLLQCDVQQARATHPGLQAQTPAPVQASAGLQPPNDTSLQRYSLREPAPAPSPAQMQHHDFDGPGVDSRDWSMA